jgi:hypothetical protein
MVVKKNTCHPQKVKQEWSAVKFNFVDSKPYFCGRHDLYHSKPFLRGGLGSFAGRPMTLACLGHSQLDSTGRSITLFILGPVWHNS